MIKIMAETHNDNFHSQIVYHFSSTGLEFAEVAWWRNDGRSGGRIIEYHEFPYETRQMTATEMLAVNPFARKISDG